MNQAEIKPASIAFNDLKTQQRRIKANIDIAIQRVLEHGHYIMGPEVYELEQQLAKFCGAKHAISCSNGTDALGLSLMAKGAGPGDAVFVPSFTFAATAEAVVWVGATPIFIDSMADTYNMSVESLELGIKTAKQLNLRPAGIIAVDLFGQPADYDAIMAVASRYGLWVIADAAQSFGAVYKGINVGVIGDITTTSFFPSKPLGCYGDGGAIFTNDDAIADKIKSMRVHGQGRDKYDNIRIGMNARLDTMQAAILLEKLKIFPHELESRQEIANLYSAGLKDIVRVPYVLKDTLSTWAQYTVRLDQAINRALLIEDLKLVGIPTAVYYVKPLHLQKAYNSYPVAGNRSLPVCEALVNEVLSLPMGAYLDNTQVEYINHCLHDITRIT